MSRAKKGQQKVSILKKTTGLCASRRYCSMNKVHIIAVLRLENTTSVYRKQFFNGSGKMMQIQNLQPCATPPYRLLASQDARCCREPRLKIKIEEQVRGVAPVRNRSSLCSFDSSRRLPLSEDCQSRSGQDCQWPTTAPKHWSVGSLRL